MSISVITRTFNRLLFLKRLLPVLKSAAGKLDVEWIIVNDGPKDDEQLADFLGEVKSLVKFKVHLVESNNANRSAAANFGIKMATKNYIHMLDDDDTIQSNFYDKTISFLEENAHFGGVCTLTEQVIETVDDKNYITEISRRPHYPELRYISFANLAVTQLFPPVSFVGRHSCFNKIGEFDVNLEVCEDYDYYLRFLSEYDIGVLPKVLCAFHRRLEEKESPSEGQNAPNAYDHLKYESLLRNKHFRIDLESEKFGLGWLLVLGEFSSSMRRLDILLSTFKKVPFVSFLFGKIRR